MSTLHTLNLALVDIEDRLTRELQFSSDAEKQILDALTIVREGLQQLERGVRSAFQERTRALSAAIGSGKPVPETVDMETKPSKKLKVVEEAHA